MRLEATDDIERGGLKGRRVLLHWGGDRPPAELFALVPDSFAGGISQRDDIFLPAVIFAALVNRTDVDLGGARVDPLLLRNTLAAAQQHEHWVSRFRTPRVTNFVADPAPRQPARQVASFFSGGIDSLFTLLRHSPERSDEPTRIVDANIGLALHVFHSAYPDSITRNAAAEASLGRGAALLGAKLVPVFSNVMTFDAEWFQNYARVTHAAGLASLARMLSETITTCLIASSHTYGALHPWGSSPIVDHLFSGRDLAIVHDGSTFRRSEKTELISTSPAALAAINVCDRLIEREGYVNCSRCQKCLRTMTALDLCGVKGDAAPAFDWSGYSPTSFGQIYFKNWSEASFAEELVELAAARGRPEVARAINSALQRSSLLSPMAWSEDKVRHLAFARRSKSLLVKLRAGTYRALGLRR